MYERDWQIGLMTNRLDCYSGIDWQSVFDGTYDAEHPEGRRFDQVKIWTRRYWEFRRRPVDPTVLQDPALWDLFHILMLAAGYSRDEVTDARLRGLASSFFVYLKDAAHEAFEALPQDVFAQYRDLVHQEPAPPDHEVMTFWQSNIPDYPAVYRDALDRWRVDTIGDLGFRPSGARRVRLVTAPSADLAGCEIRQSSMSDHSSRQTFCWALPRAFSLDMRVTGGQTL